MIENVLLLKLIHVISAAVLFGTGLGVAYFMLMAYRTRDALVIAHTAGMVVIADAVFVANAAIVEPVLWLQVRLRNLARLAAEEGEDLPARYHRLFRVWLALGWPAYIFMIAIFALMIFKPTLW